MGEVTIMELSTPSAFPVDFGRMNCPVCEQPRGASAECERCGRPFDDGIPVDALVEVSPLAGLEGTQLEGAGRAVRVERLAELEQNVHEAASAAAALGAVDAVQPMEAIELHAAHAVGMVQVQLVEGLDLGRNVDAEPKTLATEQTGEATCRYCRTKQPLAAFCVRCAMRLAAPGEGAPVLVLNLETEAERIKVRCRACGAPAYAGARCTDCGHEVPVPQP